MKHDSDLQRWLRNAARERRRVASDAVIQISPTQDFVRLQAVLQDFGLSSKYSYALVGGDQFCTFRIFDKAFVLGLEKSFRAIDEIVGSCKGDWLDRASAQELQKRLNRELDELTLACIPVRLKFMSFEITEEFYPVFQSEINCDMVTYTEYRDLFRGLLKSSEFLRKAWNGSADLAGIWISRRLP